MNVLTNFITVTISQYVHVSNNHIVHLQPTKYVNYISIKLGEKEKLREKDI